MALTTTLIILAIVFVAYILLNIFLKPFRRVAKIFSMISAFLFLGFGILIVFIYLDSSEFAKGFQTEESVYILDNNGEITTAFYLNPSNQKDVQKGLTLLSKSEIEKIADQFIQKDYNSILGDRFRLFIVKIKMFEEELPETLEFDKVAYTKQEVLDILTKESAFDIFFEKFFEEIKVPGFIDKEQMKTKFLDQLNLENQNDIKAFMFLYSLANTVLKADESGKTNSLELFEQIKKGNIEIYEKTITFKVLDFIPISQIKALMQ